MNRAVAAATASAAALFCLAPAAATAHPGPASAPPKPVLLQLDAGEEKDLADGETVIRLTLDGNGGGFVIGIVDIAAKEDEIWDILVNFERIPESTPAIKIVDRYNDGPGPHGGRVIDVGYMMEVAWVQVHYYVHHDVFRDKDYLIWSLDPTKANEIVDTTGSFSTWPSPSAGRVRFMYQTRVITGRKIPKWVEEELSVQALKKYIKFIKKVAEG